MTYRGHVKNGVVVLDEPTNLPDGVLVSVQPIESSTVEHDLTSSTFFEEFKDFIGKARNLPSDMAENHDHYLHGKPKR